MSEYRPYYEMRRDGVKAAAHERDGQQCQRCGGKEDLCAHHIDGNPQNNEVENIQTLCRACHAAEHRPNLRRLQPGDHSDKTAALRGVGTATHFKGRKALELYLDMSPSGAWRRWGRVKPELEAQGVEIESADLVPWKSILDFFLVACEL